MISLKKPKRYEDTSWDDVPKNIQEYINNIKQTRKGLYIHGGYGTGKTHTAWAIKEHLDEVPLKCRMLNVTELMSDIKADFDRSPYDKKRWEQDLTEYNGVLILDDIGAERLSDYVVEVFYLIINKRYNEMLPIIFTSNLTLGSLAEKVGERIASRIIEMCDVVELGGEDKRILKAKQSKNHE